MRSIDSDGQFKNPDALLLSVPGVGQTLSATLSKLGQTDRRWISELVGVASFNNDLGNYKRYRSLLGRRDWNHIFDS